MNGNCHLFRFYLSPTSSLLWFDLLMLTRLLEVCSAHPWALQCHQMWVVASCPILDPSTHNTVSTLPEDPLVRLLLPEAPRRR